MKTVVFDIETNGLLDKITKVYVIACVDADGKNEKVFTNQYCGDRTPDGTLEDGAKYLLQYDKIVCHNTMGFDIHVLERFFPSVWNKDEYRFKMWDTLVQSKTQHYTRPMLKGTASRHGLEYYGVMFKYPKPPVEDWSYWDAEKLHRVLVDIEINRRAYHYLNSEAAKVGLDFSTQVRRTQMAQYWYTVQEMNGWTGDKEHMEKCVEELDTMIEELRLEIEPRLPKQVKPKTAKCTWEDIRDSWEGFYRKVPSPKYDDKGKPIKEAYMPTVKFTLKNGNYDRHTAAHFGIDQDPFLSDNLVRGPYTKIEIVESKMSQHAIVKDYLLSIGWKPTQWNYQKDAAGKLTRDDKGKLIPKSPKLTEDSFESIKGDLGEKIAKYNTYNHRRRTFQNEKDDRKGWINQLREDGRIPAGAMAWATETGRCVQRNIVNVPSSAALYGAEMRRSWIASEGHTLVSVDMDSAQLRLLANYMGDYEFTRAVVDGEEFDADHNYVGTDAHTFNSRMFGLISDKDWEQAIETQDKELIGKLSKARKVGKSGIYAMLFGAGDEKFANTVGYSKASQGKAVKENYYQRLPKIRDLLDRLKGQMEQNPYGSGGYIQVAGGTWVWCGSEHKLLNYLLMGSEAVLQNQATCWVNREMKKRRLSGKMLASVHDEATFEFKIEEKEEGIKLLSEMYGASSKALGLEVLVTGTAQAGQSWLDIH